MKVLFTGLGSIGRRHLKNLWEICDGQQIQAEVTALRSTAAPLPAEICPLVSREVRALGADDQFDVAFITGPTCLHAEVMAGLNGRVGAFFIEKPIFDKTDINLSEIGLGAAQKAYVAAPMRWTGLYIALRQRLRGVTPHAVRCICSSYLPGWRPNADYRKVYSASREMGGGVALDLIHEWDYLADLFGLPDVSYCIRGQFSGLEITSDDLAVYIARYPRFACEVHLDYFGRKTRRMLEIFTEEGTLEADFITGNLALNGEVLASYTEPPNQRYLREMEYFLAYARGALSVNENSPERALQILNLAQGEPIWRAE